MNSFAIETSCDDTSVAIVQLKDKKLEVEKLLLYSQIKQHAKYWGVVPEIASRLHEEKIMDLLEEIGIEKIKSVDFISVTAEPGLPGSLIVWITTAYTLGNFLNKEIMEINHIWWHIFSLFLERSLEEFSYPMIVLTASGGHNDLYIVDFVNWKFRLEKIWYTLDDAVWEAFDKISRMLWGPYPGWPWISKNAEKYLDSKIEIDKQIWDIVYKKIRPIFLSADEFKFSFSGYKSQVYYLLQELEKKWVKLNENIVSFISYVFQEAVVEVLGKKLVKAAVKYNAKIIWIAGGVSANDRLFEYISWLTNKYKNKKKLSSDVKVIRPVKKIYSTDNAAMIGAVGILKKLNLL